MKYSLGSHTWTDFVAKAARRITEKGAPGCGDYSSSKRLYGKFHATPNLQAAIDLATNGWQAGAAGISTFLDSLPATADVLPDWTLEAVGSFPCIPAYLSGEPECMWRRQAEIRAERRLSVVVSATFGGSVEQESAQRYATAVTAVVRSLEASGIEPAVYAVNTTDPDTAYAITVRDFGTPLDLSRVAFAFHSDFLRRVQFAWQEMTPAAIARGKGYGTYGHCGTTTKEIVRHLLGDIGYTTIIPALNQLQYKDTEGMIKAISESISQTLKELV